MASFNNLKEGNHVELLLLLLLRLPAVIFVAAVLLPLAFDVDVGIFGVVTDVVAAAVAV